MTASTAQFTTRARVVDLLGREQIADAPTAMGEIFKNAMDAGASNVSVDYWPKQKCLIIGDDGLGMRTQEELLGKWLVLATDSKQQDFDPKATWLKFANPKQRTQLTTSKAFGKKGIGRLAIGLLGGGTLVWTRWGKGADAQRTLMLVPWSIFRHPFLTLDDIQIPIMTLDRQATAADARSLVKKALEWATNSTEFNHRLPPHLRALVFEELKSLFPKALDVPIEFPNTPGTQFVILSTDDMVTNHFEGWLGKESLWGEDELEDPEGPKAYLAFCNPFTSVKEPRLKIHLTESGKEMDLAIGNFWTPTDFKRVDHSLALKVDDTGFVKGIVRRFDEKFDFEWQIPHLPSRSKWPGGFKVEVGYMQGELVDSHLPPEEFQQVTKRLDAFGGFYVYMDDIRVCPYGRDNEDFIEFEKRRSLNAGRYFFSHRRMFGAVILTQNENAELVEKAGREGFQQNAAYRGLVFCLKRLFVELADTYFGSKSDRQDKAEKKAEKERKKRDERQAQQRKEFLKQFSLSRRLLSPTVSKFEAQADEVALIVKRAERTKTKSLLEEARVAQSALRDQYRTLWGEMIVSMPLEFELERKDVELLDGYLNKHADADLNAKKMLSSLAARIEQIALKVELASNTKQVGRKILDEARVRFSTELHEATKPVIEATEELRIAIQKKPEADLAELDQVVNQTSLARSESEADKLSLPAIEEAIANQSRILQDKQLPFYLKVRQQLKTLAEGDSDALEVADLRDELRLLRERELHLMELAQFGLVMETADHDFHSMLGDASRAVEGLVKICPPNAKAKVQTLKDYLQHLEDRLQGLDPLIRRVRGRVTDIGGEEIRDFIQSAFEQHRREGVVFEYTPKFLQAVFGGVKRAVLLGAVHNIVMNAGYWVTKTSKTGNIRFSIHQQGFVISDSGPGIHERDRLRVFDPGFSRRPSGRGLGLYIARSCLRSFDYDLELLTTPSTNALAGANFLIRRPQTIN